MKLSQFMGDDQFVIDFISIFQGDTRWVNQIYQFYPYFHGWYLHLYAQRRPRQPDGCCCVFSMGPSQ